MITGKHPWSWTLAEQRILWLLQCHVVHLDRFLNHQLLRTAWRGVPRGSSSFWTDHFMVVDLELICSFWTAGDHRGRRHHPRLTRLLHQTSLTCGIQQHHVDAGVALAQAPRSTIAAACRCWDCKTMLAPECRFKGVAKPAYFGQPARPLRCRVLAMARARLLAELVRHLLHRLAEGVVADGGGVLLCSSCGGVVGAPVLFQGRQLYAGAGRHVPLRPLGNTECSIIPSPTSKPWRRAVERIPRVSGVHNIPVFLPADEK